MDQLADQRVSILGTGIALVGIVKSSPRIAAIGTALSLTQLIADYVKKQPSSNDSKLQLCPVPTTVEPPFGPKFHWVLGTPNDVAPVLGSGSKISLNDLLKPYQTEKTLPDFPAVRLQPTKPSKSSASNTSRSPHANPPLQARANSAPPTLAFLSGTVRDERGNPMMGAVVTLTSSSFTGSAPEARLTDADGGYSFADVAGRYFLAARFNSALSDQELRSGSQPVTLDLRQRSLVDLKVQPVKREELARDLTPDERRRVIDFLADAAQAESDAYYANDPQYLAYYYAGPALQRQNNVFAHNSRHAIKGSLEEGHVRSVHYFPENQTVKVNTVEVWSYTYLNPTTGAGIQSHTAQPTEQIITIQFQQTQQRWYITQVEFMH